MKNKIGCFIVWYILKYHNGQIKANRKAGNTQIVRVFSQQANDNIIQPAFNLFGLGANLISKVEMAAIIVDKNNEIEKLKLELTECQDKTIKALAKCPQIEECEYCYLQGRCNVIGS